MRKFKTVLLGSIAACALSPLPALAQAAEDAAETEEGEVIIVTARRQNERLQDVPASVAVLSAASLEKTAPASFGVAIALSQSVHAASSIAPRAAANSTGRASRSLSP